MTQYRALAGINYGKDDTRVEPGETLPADFASKKTVAALLAQGVIEKAPAAQRPAEAPKTDEPTGTPTGTDSAATDQPSSTGGDSE